MDTIWNNEIVFIIWLQGLGGWLTAPMKFFTFLGSEDFFMVLLPLIYWCVDANLGLRIGSILLFSSGVNDILKLSFQGPRPYWFSTQVKALAEEVSFGLPSWHAQVAASLWGMAAALIKRPWAWLVAVFIILMTGLSRMYLGVHFPHDVLLGWMMGALVLWATLGWWKSIASWAKRKSTGQQIGLAFAGSSLMLILGLLAYGTLRNWVIPAAWLENVKQAGLIVLPAPVTLDSTITSAAVLFGMLAGLAWINSSGAYDTNGSFNQRALRILPGLIGILILNYGLRAILPRGDMFIAYLLRYIRFALVGLWISAGAPWLFQKLNLAKRKTPGRNFLFYP